MGWRCGDAGGAYSRPETELLVEAVLEAVDRLGRRRRE